jgi:hypothetical protein
MVAVGMTCMRRAWGAGLAVLAIVVSGCGGGGGGGSPATTPTGHTTAAPQRPAREVVALKRWTGSDPVVSEVRIESDGTARTRQIVGGLTGRRDVTRHIPADRFARVRALVARARLRGADTSADPVGGGYQYILRIGGRSVRTADGHLAPGVRPLIIALDRLWDRTFPS